ncbi:flippase-like domain-containing protein [Halospeciosus flavus]|uniref:Flippase-like domain-containing protein n=1 Tax=Halospeciosus flavus TaxID=3032283 RepID=A0ABD5Z695_9EURY|nr:flippase-like domain-containing protein [Halospeciosus flavus]
MAESRVEVSVVLPAYNEEHTIEETVETTLDTLADFLPDGTYEVIVAEDGCDDRTPEIADRLAREDERVRHFHSDERLGRGGALDAAFRAAEGETLVYFDTDLATDMRHLEELVESVRSGDYDLATGSRWMPENVADRPAKRGIPSRGFNLATRLLLGSELRDHQCGFKAFSREAFRDLVVDVEDEHWFWDTEMLVRAQRKGYRVREFPVDWEPKGDSKVDLVRDVFGMGSQILRCFWEFKVSPYANRRTGALAGILLTLVAIALMTVYLDPSAVLAEMRDANPALVAAAGAIYVLSWPLRGLRYRDILSELGYRESVGFLTGAVFISQTGNLVFPARAGDAVRAYVVKARRNVPYASGFASLAVERVFDLLTITLLAGSVLLGLAAFAPEAVADVVAALSGTGETLSGDQHQSATTAIAVAGLVGAVAIGAVGVIVASARFEGNFVRRAVSWASDDSYVAWVADILEQFVGDVQRVAADGSAFARVGGSSVLVWTIDVLTAVLVFAAFDTGLSLVTLLAVGFFAVSVGNLAKVLPLSPGGIGLYEGAFTLLVVALTPVSPAAALGVAIVDHAVKNVVTVVGGVASMLALNVSLTEAAEGAEHAATPADD